MRLLYLQHAPEDVLRSHSGIIMTKFAKEDLQVVILMNLQRPPCVLWSPSSAYVLDKRTNTVATSG